MGWKRDQNAPAALEQIPDGWQIVDMGLLGRGGMSHVHRVRDETLGREVALKMLKSDLSKEPKAVEYFLQEAQVTAQLEHPNIPPVYALAAEKKLHCFTMKVLEGATLDQALQSRPELTQESLLSALEVLVRVCDALAFAHQKGVIHCDLKPQNIMVGEHGQIYLVDWGLSRRKGVPIRMPGHEDAALGTPAYMAPEQAHGRNDAIDERTDIFQVGAVLYKVLVGRAPFSAASGEEALQLAKKCRPMPVELAGRGRPIPRRLAAIAERALAASPAERYQTVSELRKELEDFIHGTSRLPDKLYKAGEAVVREGEPGDCAYIILDGHCQASKKAAGGLRLMGPGEMFGETAVLTGSPRLATVTALVDTTVAVVDQSYIQEEMQRTPLIALAIRAVAERFLDLDGQTTALTLEQTRFKVIDLALQELALVGEPASEGEGRWVAWKALEAKIAAQTKLAPEAIAERISRHPALKLDAAADRLVLKRPPPR